MSDQQILKAISDEIRDERLHFQIIIQEQTLYVYINRDTEEYIDYRELTANIHSAISALDELDLLTMELYSRALGEVEPDWQTSVELLNRNSTPESCELIDDLNNAVENTKSLIVRVEQELNTIPENQSLTDSKAIANSKESDRDVSIDPWETTPTDNLEPDFSQYCFTRNKGLLNAEIVAPSQDIARIIDTFNKFESSLKRSQLSLLEDYFKKSQKPDLEDFELVIQSWWTEIYSIDDRTKRKLAIWLSRYCYDAENTMVSIENVFSSSATVKKISEEEAIRKAKEEREAQNNVYLKSLNSPNIPHSGKKQAQKSKSSISSWISYISALIAIRVLFKLFFGSFSNFQEYVSNNKAAETNSEVETSFRRPEPSQIKQLIKSGFDKYHQKDFDSALVDFTQAIELNTDEEDFDGSLGKTYNLRGLVHQGLNDHYKAIEDANKAIELAPYKSNYYANRGLAHLELRDYSSAIADQTHAIKLEPKNSYWYFYRGKAYHEMGYYDKALADLDLAIQLNYFTIEAYEQRYYTHTALGNFKKAEADYEKAKYFGNEPQR